MTNIAEQLAGVNYRVMLSMCDTTHFTGEGEQFTRKEARITAEDYTILFKASMHPLKISNTVIEEIIAEREKQIGYGFESKHDDKHINGELLSAAKCYMKRKPSEKLWPWYNFFKPKTHRKNLVRACTFIIAEIERLDRLKETKRAQIQKQKEDKEL